MDREHTRSGGGGAGTVTDYMTATNAELTKIRRTDFKHWVEDLPVDTAEHVTAFVDAIAARGALNWPSG